MRVEFDFAPLPAQWKFIASNAKHPAFIAGIGSGKTTVGAFRSMLWAALGDGMVVAPTYPMLRDATQHSLFTMLREQGVPFRFNKNEQEMSLLGHRVLFRTGDNPDRLRGANLTWAWVDEPAMQKQLVWPILLGRLRVAAKRHEFDGIVYEGNSAWVTGTPAGFNWVHDRWTGDDPNYELINASTADNVHLPPEYIADLEASYSGEFAAQELHGQFVAFEGLVYDEFRRGIHVIDAPPPERWRRVASVDFGYTNPFVCLWGAVDEDGRLTIYDEHYKRRELIEYHAAQILARGDVDWTVSDHDAQDIAELRKYGINTIRAQKDVSLGIQRVKARMMVQGDGKPRLYVHESCVNLLREIGQYRWRENGREEPVKESDHAMDALRYMVMQLDSGADASPHNRSNVRPRSAGIRGGGNW